METEKFDLIVIGGGPAGEKGAAQAAYFGKRVALVESASEPGGACTNTGTLPSKTLRETAVHLSGLSMRGLLNVNYDLNATVSASHLKTRKDMVVEAERRRIHNNISRHHIAYIQGFGRFADAHTLEVLDAKGSPARRLEAPFILIATGSTPHRPAEIPFDDVCVWDSDTVLNLKKVPASLTVIGAGVIGSEYASIFAALGCKVELVDGRDTLLPFLDKEIADVLTRELEKLGVRFHFKATVKSYTRRGDSVLAVLDGGETLETEALLFAAGRNGNTKGLGLDKIGVVPDKRGQIKVNEHYQTDAPHVYAAGDVIGFPALASTSMDQGRLAMCHAFQLTYLQRLAEHLPMGIYTIPEVSSVGETEESARKKGLDIEVGRARFSENARAQIMGDTGGVLKLVFDSQNLRVLGVHIVCERASDIITPGLFALRLETGIDFFIDTVFNFPTLCEAYKYAAYDGLGRLGARGRDTGKTLREKGGKPTAPAKPG